MTNVGATAVVAVIMLGALVPILPEPVRAIPASYEFVGHSDCIFSCRVPADCQPPLDGRWLGVICIPANTIGTVEKPGGLIVVTNDAGDPRVRLRPLTIRVCQDNNFDGVACTMTDLDKVGCETVSVSPQDGWLRHRNTYVIIAGPGTTTFANRCIDARVGVHGFVSHT